MIVGLCDRFKKLPSEVLDEDASLLGLVAIAERGRPPEQDPGLPGMSGMSGGDW